MRQGTGRAVCGGVAVGKAAVYRPTGAKNRQTADPAAERLAFDRARQEADRALAAVAAQTRSTLGDDAADILEMQRLMLADAEYTDAVHAAIERGHAATEAALSCGEALATTLLKTGDDVMAARGADVRDAARRVYELLGGDGFSAPDEPFVLVAEELLPSMLLSMPRGFLRGIATRGGTALDHAAILAKGLGVPYLVGCDVPLDTEGEVFAVDAANGAWYADPDKETLARLERASAQKLAQRTAASAYATCDSVTKGGKRVSVSATIALPREAHDAFACGADGIGLLRSEWLYLERETPPEEEELYAAYREAVTAMGGRPVVIRAPDIGGDKTPPYAATAEANPALGVRGVRWCLRHPDVFDTHLRAVCRAATAGEVRLLIPMVTTLEEWHAVCARLQAVTEELSKRDVPFGDVALGVMIETPAAALTAEALCRQAAFVSVGTNDLVQYTMAADRQNAAVETLCDPRHEAVHHLLAEVAKAAAVCGIEAGVCGELAADTTWVEPLLKMGYTALSVPPDCVGTVRRAVCESEVG